MAPPVPTSRWPRSTHRTNDQGRETPCGHVNVLPARIAAVADVRSDGDHAHTVPSTSLRSLGATRFFPSGVKSLEPSADHMVQWTCPSAFQQCGPRCPLKRWHRASANLGPGSGKGSRHDVVSTVPSSPSTRQLRAFRAPLDISTFRAPTRLRLRWLHAQPRSSSYERCWTNLDDVGCR